MNYDKAITAIEECVAEIAPGCLSKSGRTGEELDKWRREQLEVEEDKYRQMILRDY